MFESWVNKKGVNESTLLLCKVSADVGANQH